MGDGNLFLFLDILYFVSNNVLKDSGKQKMASGKNENKACQNDADTYFLFSAEFGKSEWEFHFWNLVRRCKINKFGG